MSERLCLPALWASILGAGPRSRRVARHVRYAVSAIFALSARFIAQELRGQGFACFGRLTHGDQEPTLVGAEIAFPVLRFSVPAVSEMSPNTKQLANHDVFCAARAVAGLRRQHDR